MKFLKTNNEETNIMLKQVIRKVDDDIIEKLAYSCLNITRSDDEREIYHKNYQTKYPIKNLSYKESALENYLFSIEEKAWSNLRTNCQGDYYRWIFINEYEFGKIYFRYYFAPNPSNLHEIVRLLTKEFVSQNIPVEFKYQLDKKCMLAIE